MQARGPSLRQVMVAVAFAFSCFSLLLFLWTAFGGPVPFSPEGYRVKVPFREATQLAAESDVRIANVSVGKVKEIERNAEGDAVATMEIDERYAPIPRNTRAILRQKTLLGETYVELTPGDEGSGDLGEGGSLPAAQVSDAVQLDEIFRTFDSRTRAAFRQWMQEAAIATAGRGADLNAALGNLEPFAADANRVLRILHRQSGAVRGLIRNGGELFEALSERRGQLSGLIRNADTVFATTAARDRELRETFIALPTFLEQSRLTVRRLERFARDTDPLITQLRPAARELSATLKPLAKLAPHLRKFFAGLRLVALRSRTGLPALQRLLTDDLPPMLAQLDPFLRQLTPILEVANVHRRDITAGLANTTAATNASFVGPDSFNTAIHYLRVFSPLGPESLAVYPRRLRINRFNPYTEPGGALKVNGGLESFRIAGGPCDGGGISATLTNPAGPNQFPAEFFERIQRFAFGGAGNTDSDAIPVPPCKLQGLLRSIGEIPELTYYRHVWRDNP